MFTSRSNLPPPQTHSSIKQRKFNALGEKKLVHLLQSPLEVHVDPAPLRRLNGDGADGAATPREVRDALDRGVPGDGAQAACAPSHAQLGPLQVTMARFYGVRVVDTGCFECMYPFCLISPES